MDSFPPPGDYFSNSQSSSSTNSPWDPTIPRSVPSWEDMLLTDEDAMDALPCNYTHSPMKRTGRSPTKFSTSEDFFLTMEKTAGTGKRSRFSEFFRWNPTVASKNTGFDLPIPHVNDPELPGFHTYYTTERNPWSTNQLQSAIQPVNPCLANVIPSLERSVWNTTQEEIARHIRTTSEEKQRRKQLAPIGTPKSPKPSTTNQPHSDIFQPIALSEHDIGEALSKNWETLNANPLTAREVTWLMRLHNAHHASTTRAPPAAHTRHVSTDSSRGSLSPEASSSLIVSLSASSPATSTSTAAHAKALAHAKRSRAVGFSNAEAQAQHQREVEIAYMKEQRAREAVRLPPSVAPAAAPMPVPMRAVSSRLPPSTAAAAPFVPAFAGTTGIAGLAEGTMPLGKEEWTSFLERQILEWQEALELVNASEGEL